MTYISLLAEWPNVGIISYYFILLYNFQVLQLLNKFMHCFFLIYIYIYMFVFLHQHTKINSLYLKTTWQ